MKEIKFLKDLPIKLVNQNQSYINIAGGDVYYDKDGNRFAFITFKNLTKSPVYSLQISYREYSAEGKLIKDGEFFIPYMYEATGEFVNEEPIEIDQQTEAMEIFISKAVFDKNKFENDRFTGFTKVDYIEEPKRAPKKKWDAPRTQLFFDNAAPIAPQAQPVSQSQPAPQVSEPVKAEEPVLASEQPAQEAIVQPQEQPKQEVVIDKSKLGTFKKVNLLLQFAPAVLIIALGIVLAIIAVGRVKYGIEMFNYYN